MDVEEEREDWREVKGEEIGGELTTRGAGLRAVGRSFSS